MRNELQELTPSKWKFVLTITLLCLSLGATVFSFGKQWAAVEQVNERLDAIDSAIIAVKLSEKDIEWLKSQHKELVDELKEIRASQRVK